MSQRPVVKRICTLDELRGLIRKCEQSPEYGKRMIQGNGEPLPDDWTPETEIRELHAAGFPLVSLGMREGGEPSLWNVMLATRANLHELHEIEKVLRQIAADRGVQVESLLPLVDDLLEIRDPKAKRDRSEAEQAMLIAARELELCATTEEAAEQAGITARGLRKMRKSNPVFWELAQAHAKKTRPAGEWRKRWYKQLKKRNGRN